MHRADEYVRRKSSLKREFRGDVRPGRERHATMAERIQQRTAPISAKNAFDFVSRHYGKVNGDLLIAQACNAGLLKFASNEKSVIRGKAYGKREAYAVLLEHYYGPEARKHYEEARTKPERAPTKKKGFPAPLRIYLPGGDYRVLDGESQTISLRGFKNVCIAKVRKKKSSRIIFAPENYSGQGEPARALFSIAPSFEFGNYTPGGKKSWKNFWIVDYRGRLPIMKIVPANTTKKPFKEIIEQFKKFNYPG